MAGQLQLKLTEGKELNLITKVKSGPFSKNNSQKCAKANKKFNLFCYMLDIYNGPFHRGRSKWNVQFCNNTQTFNY